MSSDKNVRTDESDPTEIPTVTEESGSLGAIKINHSVVANIVRLSALEVDGTYAVGSSGFAEGLTEMFKGKDSGVRVSEDEAENYIIEVKVVLKFGVELAKTAYSIQQNIKDQVTRMTMKGVARVDVIIDGVKMETVNRDEPTEDEFSGSHAD